MIGYCYSRRKIQSDMQSLLADQDNKYWSEVQLSQLLKVYPNLPKNIEESEIK